MVGIFCFYQKVSGSQTELQALQQPAPAQATQGLPQLLVWGLWARTTPRTAPGCAGFQHHGQRLGRATPASSTPAKGLRSVPRTPTQDGLQPQGEGRGVAVGFKPCGLAEAGGSWDGAGPEAAGAGFCSEALGQLKATAGLGLGLGQGEVLPGASVSPIVQSGPQAARRAEQMPRDPDLSSAE